MPGIALTSVTWPGIGATSLPPASSSSAAVAIGSGRRRRQVCSVAAHADGLAQVHHGQALADAVER